LPELLDPLSEQEIVVIRLCAWGATIADIATDLHIERSTVATHLSRIYSKLQARNQPHAVTIAIRCGYVTLDDIVHCQDWTPPMVRED
jgi:DNA-binding NarL/FixJ family response regulator